MIIEYNNKDNIWNVSSIAVILLNNGMNIWIINNHSITWTRNRSWINK